MEVVLTDTYRYVLPTRDIHTFSPLMIISYVLLEPEQEK